MTDYTCAAGCGRAVPPWQPAICPRCIDAEADRLRREWAEENGA